MTAEAEIFDNILMSFMNPHCPLQHLNFDCHEAIAAEQ